MAYFDTLPRDAHLLGHERLAAQWICTPTMLNIHEHTIKCLWVWHFCTQVLGPDTEAPGELFGWRPSGARTHDFVSAEPLELSPSVYWPECCGLHGWIRGGLWINA